MSGSEDYVHINTPLIIKEQPLFGNLELPCGCRVDVRHDTGDRLVACPGGGEYQQTEMIEDDPVTIIKKCGGGRAYVVTAEPQPPIYFASAASQAMVDRVNSLGPS